MFESVQQAQKGARRRSRYVVLGALLAAIALSTGWLLYQDWREHRILDCDAKTFDELRSSLGRPSGTYEEDGKTCWQYEWMFGVSTWCSTDGVNVEKGWTLIE